MQERDEGFYGLPLETDRDVHNWQEVVSYLDAIRESGQAVLFYCGDLGTEQYEAIVVPGYLREPTITSERGGCTIMPLHWPRPGDRCAYVSLPHPRFKGGHLSTTDGCVYFSLRLDFDTFTIKIADANTY
jgi:hypothetical protein